MAVFSFGWPTFIHTLYVNNFFSGQMVLLVNYLVIKQKIISSISDVFYFNLQEHLAGVTLAQGLEWLKFKYSIRYTTVFGLIVNIRISPKLKIILGIFILY